MYINLLFASLWVFKKPVLFFLYFAIKLKRPEIIFYTKNNFSFLQYQVPNITIITSLNKALILKKLWLNSEHWELTQLRKIRHLFSSFICRLCNTGIHSRRCIEYFIFFLFFQNLISKAALWMYNGPEKHQLTKNPSLDLQIFNIT